MMKSRRQIGIVVGLGFFLGWGTQFADPLQAEPATSIASSTPVSQAASQQPPEFFDLQQIRPGLKGSGLTVIEGTQPEPFPVDIIGLVKKAGPGGSDLVLVRVGGAVVDKAGGIAAGMSGSPIYIGNQLLGALGYGFELADHSLGLVTPAPEMAKVLAQVTSAAAATRAPSTPSTATEPAPPSAPPKEPAKKEAQKDGSDTVGGTPQGSLAEATGVGFDRVAIAPALEVGRRWQQELGEKVGVFVPVSVPVMVTGLSGRAMERLRQGLARYPVQLAVGLGGSAAGESTSATPPDLKWPAPGQAFAVQLVRGDVDVSALGTITWVDGDRFVGFGHPFLNKGAVHFFVGPAAMVGSVPSVSMPFKVGYPLAAQGTLLQDRSAAVAGQVGQLPSTVQVDVRVQEDGQPRAHTQAEIVWDEELVGSLGSSVLLQAVDRALDRVGQGSATVTVTANVEGIDSPLSRVNLFSSPVDIAAEAVSEAAELMDLVASNPFTAARLTRLSVKVDVVSRRNEAEILRVKAPSGPVHPGDKVQLEVTLLPYRGEQQTRILVLQLPQDLPEGPLTVSVRGGDTYGTGSAGTTDPGAPPDKSGKSSGSADMYAAWLGGEKPPASLADLLNEFVTREHNNDLIAEYWVSPQETGASTGSREAMSLPPASAPESSGRLAKDGQKASTESAPTDGRRGQVVQTKLPTPYVVNGWIDVDLDVVAADKGAVSEPVNPPASNP
ncbi:MAG: hypothetical protein IMX01_05530 [Limnochordaceae bacterium]|nr:hypothetical protein [Limnochordaceae bacterium]